MKKIFLSILCAAFFVGAFAQKITTQWIDQQFKDADVQSKTMFTLLPDSVFPRNFEQGKLNTCESESWITGFYPGTLLYIYEQTKDKAILDEAIKRTNLLEKEQYNRDTHDLGFMILCSYGNLYRLTKDDKYKQIIINSAKSLATRFNPTVGSILSWGKMSDTTQFRVIIDNMMNLEMLMWAAKETGDKSLRDIAITHANTTMKNHFRKDYSSYHVVVYNPLTGEVKKKQTAQGAADESAWARGQGWGLYGFTMMYRETKHKAYLKQAQNIAKFILNNPNLPVDKVPYWDFNAPGIPNALRDASAASVTASAFLELAQYSDKKLAKEYISAAETILQSLSSNTYKAPQGTNGGFLLMHSVKHMPKNSEIDVPLPYADYYYVEALSRLKALKS